MYIDTAAGGCAKATFDFGAAAVSRSYEIKVTLVSSKHMHIDHIEIRNNIFDCIEFQYNTI